jgi:uncharacterized protein (UPF0297 family)
MFYPCFTSYFNSYDYKKYTPVQQAIGYITSLYIFFTRK